MNPMKNLLLFSFAGASLTSCVVTDYPPGTFSTTGPATYGYYDNLPETYVGETYNYGGRYYYGGRYERGSFFDQGRTYQNRYYHNGRYYYGGHSERHGDRRPESGSRDHSGQGYYQNRPAGGSYRMPR